MTKSPRLPPPASICPFSPLNILGLPDDGVPPSVAHRILAGGAAKAREADCLILGGHSIRNPQPIYGLSVSGWVHPRRIITHAGARPGDLLVLTVADTGAGIDLSRHEEYFRPFMTTRDGAVGLGLTAARALAHVNGGSLRFVSPNVAELRVPAR